jgi:hypothetical protein
MNSKDPLRVLTHGSQSILCELCGLLFRIFGSAESSRKSLICRRSSTKTEGFLRKASTARLSSPNVLSSAER